MTKYDHKAIERKWQKRWEETQPNCAFNPGEKPRRSGKVGVPTKASGKKQYILIEFPYPSGDGLHTGHVRSYTAMDIVARKRRAEGFNVLYPIGWDAFGLPTENFAIKTGISPQIATKQNTDIFRRQLKALGMSFDWSREINTTDPKYYKWTQWIFLQLFKKGLAYKAKMPINWCPTDKIGLANEEVVDGKCERCGTAVEKREKEQWMLAITKYADRLDKDLDSVNYLERIKIQQRNWIGRSEGAVINFQLVAPDLQEKVIVFTTRPDTLFGATYLVLAPEHPLLPALERHVVNWDDIAAYIIAAQKKPDIERTAEGKEKSGVKLIGIQAVNPANNEAIPVFIADYVLAHYGTGAIMAVPAHDERDYQFAKKYNLPIKQVIEPEYIQTTEPGIVRKDLPFVERDGVITIVKHWAEDKYLGLRWKTVAWGTWVTGGIEEGQTAEDASRAEVLQEVGYKNMRLVKNLGIVHGKFYHVPKKENRLVHGHCLYFELTDDVKDAVAQDEQEKHEAVWLTTAEVEQFLTPDTHRWAWRELREGGQVYTGEGYLTHSGAFDSFPTEEAKKKITEFVGGELRATYKLRDWVFSRQRYWGEPIPIIHCEKCGMVPVPEKELPVELPKLEKYQPTDTGESPLASVSLWVNVPCPKCGGKAKRETDVMPNWAGSSWYFLRYTDPNNLKEFASAEALKYWTPVDWYNGGMEHTTLHLLYSRFWHKFLFDLGAVPSSEPYAKRTSHGLVLASDEQKMSKSLGNVVNPDEIIEQFGADTLRMYEMFMGPFDQSVVWSTDNMVGSYRFLERLWRLSTRLADEPAAPELEVLLNQSIKKVSEDIENMKFNTAVSQLMILLNEFEKYKEVPTGAFTTLVRLAAPFAPHVAEELWERAGYSTSVHAAPWPSIAEERMVSAKKIIVVQVNGKTRSVIETDAGADEKEIEDLALALPAILKWVGGKEVIRVIKVPGRLINFVVKEGA